MSDHLIDRILLFEKAEIFAGLNLDERAAIASLAKIERHHSGQAIYRQGDPSTTLYVLIKGGIDFHRDGSFVGRMESGTSQDFFGDIGFLDRKPRPYSATACKSTEFTEIFAVNRQDFMDLVADRIELWTVSSAFLWDNYAPSWKPLNPHDSIWLQFLTTSKISPDL